MEFGESELVRSEGGNRLLKIGARGGKEVFCVISDNGKQTLHFDDYEDALEEFNLRWMQEKFGE